MEDVQSAGSENFDFMEAAEAGPKIKKGDPKPDVFASLMEDDPIEQEYPDDIEAVHDQTAKVIATSGSLTPEIIAEARALAESKKGLDIDKFVNKYNLVNFNIERVLNGPLDKEGNLI